MNPSLQRLLQRPDLWRPRDRRLPGKTGGSGVATGFRELDRALYGGGWPRAALTELLSERSGIGELRLLAPLLATLAAQQLWQLWINPPFIPYAPALLQHGIDPSRLVIVRADARQQLWACEQALRSAACGAVLYWPGAPLRYGELRKLQVAAGAQQCAGFLLRDSRSAPQTSPAALRLQLSADDDHLLVQIVKQRGGNAGQCVSIAHPAALHMQSAIHERPAITSSAIATATARSRRGPRLPTGDGSVQQVIWQ
jgi:cell division inhibitor SulA/protein ImuA